MTIKKLTVAAAIAVGIATCSFNSAMAACPCEQRPVVTESSCCPAEDIPVVTGQACPCQTEEPSCGCNVPDCDEPAVPSCAVCPNAAPVSRCSMNQVYAYPNAIYGSNNYIGECSSSAATFRGEGGFTIGTNGLSSTTMGAAVLPEGSMTGAATDIPCLSDSPVAHSGVPILRDERKMDGNGCPIQISTANSIQAIKKTMVPLDLSQFNNVTGAAADMPSMNMFPDVPNNYWASCPIDKLAMNDVVVGYPDRMFKPSRNISRAEFATMIVKGFNKNDCGCGTEALFSDVPTSHWANSVIAKAVHENLLKGYPDGLFKPNNNVTRAEALCALSKGINIEMDAAKAQQVLSCYSDCASVPEWARIPIAKALESGALKSSPNSKMIRPYAEATRAEIASMLQNVRVAMGYDTNPTTANDTCPICPTDKKAYVENEQIVKIPTLELKFLDEINAKSSHVGQIFAAKTLEDVTIDGQCFPCGSKVTGKVVEVVRPSGCQKGALKLAFTDISNNGCKAKLPRQILTAQVDCSKQPNIIARLVTAPFTWAGSMVGIVGRTTGGMLSNLGNAVENVSNGTGIALGDIFQGQFGASARSLGGALFQTVKAPIDITRTALSGTFGLLQSTGDEVAYLVDAKGYKISSINPREHVTIAFGCSE